MRSFGTLHSPTLELFLHIKSVAYAFQCPSRALVILPCLLAILSDFGAKSTVGTTIPSCNRPTLSTTKVPWKGTTHVRSVEARGSQCSCRSTRTYMQGLPWYNRRALDNAPKFPSNGLGISMSRGYYAFPGTLPRFLCDPPTRRFRIFSSRPRSNWVHDN